MSEPGGVFGHRQQIDARRGQKLAQFAAVVRFAVTERKTAQQFAQHHGAKADGFGGAQDGNGLRIAALESGIDVGIQQNGTHRHNSGSMALKSASECKNPFASSALQVPAK